MTHVSKYRMKRKIESRISTNFTRALFSASGSQGHEILRSLLTLTEQTMLAKRLALIVMLEKEFSYYRISKSLKMSTSTIKRIHGELEAGAYEPIIKALRGRMRVSFLELLELLLTGGRPITGAGHKKRLNDIRRRLWTD
ncbi:hypothetical protein A3F27_01570 [Candidatus Kaiserbacteria bacterium RIFCSPHIGHO2_12_FULL_53_13]|uniref:Uncharacterized protein n=1 Tax=Candidatus Kaiserbacteria bacterium RIFCSPHIGHO2_12_FULL_53_13 TaxID=1798502 RepID=A0A1F6E817_9BACT|nr:MAG: hypothetical protein A3F27_01570 [Candidatus Kaiserbacteria bacterium RIFCSPHIGHO2_12_FULL_53_13]